eukprot:15479611-Alexandrium_andersonii.AAC.1
MVVPRFASSVSAKTLQETLKIEAVLRYGWNLRRYDTAEQAERQANAGGGAGTGQPNLQVVDEPINSDLWWSLLRTL